MLTWWQFEDEMGGREREMKIMSSEIVLECPQLYHLILVTVYSSIKWRESERNVQPINQKETLPNHTKLSDDENDDK